MKILVTGGAGFIGSNLVATLLQNENISLVRVLDNFATGCKKNIEEFLGNPKFELIDGDIRNSDDCMMACNKIEAISHQAALGSVPRSINDPLTSHNVNVNGFINILEAAKKNDISRIVYASSSSVYGDLGDSPKVESRVGKVLSPYAATKVTNEVYAEAYSKNFNMTLFGFRYFNVFGPKQDPEGPYAAVIPLFIKAALKKISPQINGDGSITRDFTPVDNVVQINVNALFAKIERGTHDVFNVACGKSTSLNEIWKLIENATGIKLKPNYVSIRKGDILYSLADISKAKRQLNYNPNTDLDGMLQQTIDYYKNNKF